MKSYDKYWPEVENTMMRRGNHEGFAYHVSSLYSGENTSTLKKG